MKSKPCSLCGSPYHTQTFCRMKPHKPLKRSDIKRSQKPLAVESPKSRTKRIRTYKKWMATNPPDSTGHWECYLQISSLCPRMLTRDMLTLEHVMPKVKAPELKYEIANIRPSCAFCNKMKGSRTLDELVKLWPHLVKYLGRER